MAALNEKGFERKLQQMSMAQDSIQTVSLWIIHHKKYAADIVKVWIDNLKKCNPDRRLVLFYLANDVLQNSRKKGKEFSTAFSKVLLDVIHLLSEKKIGDSVQRVMKIWQERKVFDKDFLENLQRKFELCQNKAIKTHSHTHKAKPSTTDSDSDRGSNKNTQEKRAPPPDFKPSKLIEALKAMRDLQSEVTLKESRLNSLRIDASDMEAIKQLKDRSTGAKFTAEYETASENLESFCETLKLQKKEIAKLIESLEDGKAFYDSAFSEVKVIVHAYKTFGNRLNSLKKKIDHKVAKIINAEAERKKMGPIHTPHSSFLTSGLPDISSAPSTPTHKSEDKNSETADTTVDNTDVTDMDIEDDDNSENEESQSQSPSDSTSTPSSDVKVTETPVLTTASSVSIATTTASAISTSASSSSPTNFTTNTSTMHMPLPAPPQMMIPQPHMQFIPGQPGLPMIPVGMPGAGQFLSMPSNYPQPMVPYGMGMHSLGSYPGQPHMTTIPLPGQAPFPGMAPNLQQRIPVSVAGSQIPMASNSLTPVINQSPLPGQSIPTTTQEAPLAQPASNIGSLSTTTSTQSVIKPLPSSRSDSIDSTKMEESVGSPSSEVSAPSPVGSPELELGGDETPETASPQRVDDVKILSVPEQTNQETGEEASGPSTGSASPSQSSDLSKPVSAVNILAQLISRGRQLKQQTPSTSGASTPKEEPVPEVQPKQEKPLYTLIDSLFPKLTDSLKTIREKEKDNDTSTSTSEEGSPKQKIEINSMGDNDDDDDSENDREPSMLVESSRQVPAHMGPMGFHHPQEFAHGNPRGPFAGHPHDGSMGQPWNKDHFPGHARPPFRDYQERPQVPPQSPIKGPGHSPRFPGPPREFQGHKGTFFDSHENEPEGPRDEYRGMPHRSPRQLHSPRASLSRPEEHELELNDGPPIEHAQRGPRGSFAVGPQNHGSLERGPHPGSHPRQSGPPEMHWVNREGSFPHHEEHRGPQPIFEGPRGPRPRHEGPRAPYRERPRPQFEGPGGPRPRHEGPRGPHPRHEGPRIPHPNHEEPRRPHLHHEGPRMYHEGPRGPSPRIDGPRTHRPYSEGLRGPHHEGPRLPHPHVEGPRPTHPHHEDLRESHLPHEGPRGFQRSFSDSEGELAGEPPIKRQILDEAPPRSFNDQGRPRPGFPPSSPGFDRNREMWRDREHWESHQEHQDRIRPDFHNREGHLSPRFVVDYGDRPFPPHERPFAPRRNSFKGFDQRDHFMRPRFPGGHPRPFY